MPITVTAGVLLRRYEYDDSGVVTAVVRYTLSNGEFQEKTHQGIPMAGLQALAVAAGRAEYSRSDIIQFITNVFGDDLSPAVITAPDLPTGEG